MFVSNSFKLHKYALQFSKNLKCRRMKLSIFPNFIEREFVNERNDFSIPQTIPIPMTVKIPNQQPSNQKSLNIPDIRAPQNHHFNVQNGNVQMKKFALALRIAVMDDGHVAVDTMNLDAARVRDHPLLEAFSNMRHFNFAIFCRSRRSCMWSQ